MNWLRRLIGWPLAGIGFTIFTVGGGLLMLGLWLSGEED
jgi:hypothetical protein